jgi:hypothetical protein
MWHGCAGMFPGKKVGMQVLAGLALSGQSVGSLFKPPFPMKPTQKNDLSIATILIIFIFLKMYSFFLLNHQRNLEDWVIILLPN